MSLAWQLQWQANARGLAGPMTQTSADTSSPFGHPDIKLAYATHTLCIESQRTWKVGDCRKRSGGSLEVHLAFRTDCKSKRAGRE
jgi:hypothetical protein